MKTMKRILLIVAVSIAATICSADWWLGSAGDWVHTTVSEPWNSRGYLHYTEDSGSRLQTGQILSNGTWYVQVATNSYAANPAYATVVADATMLANLGIDPSQTYSAIKAQLGALDPVGTNGFVQKVTLTLLGDVVTGQLAISAQGTIITPPVSNATVVIYWQVAP